MNIVFDFFESTAAAIQDEVQNHLLCSPILTACDAERNSPLDVLEQILSEHTIRYLGLRRLYERLPTAGNVTFEVECSIERDKSVRGRIDLILATKEEGTNRDYAVEMKWWRNEDAPELLRNDHAKLIAYMDRESRQHGYEVIVTRNKDSDLTTSDRKDKAAYYKGLLGDLGGKFTLCAEPRVLEFSCGRADSAFTICVYLAAAHPQVSSALA